MVSGLGSVDDNGKVGWCGVSTAALGSCDRVRPTVLVEPLPRAEPHL